MKIIFEDEQILVINKPAGLVVDRSETQKTDTLEDWLANKGTNLAREGIVHRLDKDTSGLLIVAKTPQALEKLQEQFKARVVKKEYLALVHGIITEAGTVVGSIGRNPRSREKFTVLQAGKEAITAYEPIEKFQHFTLLRCLPKTGRTHQIRVHLKYIGHPLVADEKYAGRKTNRSDRKWCPRMFLHAAKIGFRHPESGEWIEFESELPDDLEKALKSL